jgi:hypothetical protein
MIVTDRMSMSDATRRIGAGVALRVAATSQRLRSMPATRWVAVAATVAFLLALAAQVARGGESSGPDGAALAATGAAVAPATVAPPPTRLATVRLPARHAGQHRDRRHHAPGPHRAREAAR